VFPLNNSGDAGTGREEDDASDDAIYRKDRSTTIWGMRRRARRRVLL